MSAPVFPPVNPAPWDGDPVYLIDQAAAILRLQPTDPDIDRLGRLAYSASALVATYLDWATTPGGIPDPVTDACINALVEAYRRKDAPFGVASAWNTDGSAMYVSRDWLMGVQMALQPYKQQFGFA